MGKISLAVGLYCSGNSKYIFVAVNIMSKTMDQTLKGDTKLYYNVLKYYENCQVLNKY